MLKKDNKPELFFTSRLMQPVNLLFLVSPSSDLSDFLEECHKLLCYSPGILNKINKDLDDYGKSKKKVRLLDKEWEVSDNRTLTGISICFTDIDEESLSLEGGCPRMDSALVYLFLMVRGRFGGIKNKDVQILLSESKSIHLLLRNFGLESLPGLSTICDNINAVSEETRQYIFDSQIRMIIEESLDDFKDLTIDSTSVSANSAWPTDSTVLLGLVRRLYHRGKQLHKFGTSDISTRRFPNIIKTITELNKQIQFTVGKPKGKSKRKKMYHVLLKECRSAGKAFSGELMKVNKNLKNLKIAPSRYHMLLSLIEWMEEDLLWLSRVIAYCFERIENDKIADSKTKKLSLSDRSASFIRKGNREDVIGYKPQLCRSKQGFIPGLRVPKGNAADSAEFLKIAGDSIARTGVVPDTVSVDDGYANTDARNKLLEMGIKVVSISGSKGKRIICEEDWASEGYIQARNDRSAVESLMFTIKYGFDFGKVMRRGIENVRAELLEKVLAYNFCRINEIRKRKYLEELAA